MRRLSLSLTVLGLAIGVMLWPLGAQVQIIPALQGGPISGTTGTFSGAISGTSITGTSDVTGRDLVAGAARFIYFTGRGLFSSPADGQVTIGNNATTIGSVFKADALPTVSAGFGTSPSVTAGSTPLAGEVNVGTGGIATTGTLLYNGTAFPSAPFCVCQDSTSIAAGVCKAKSTTTTLVLTTTVAWTASDLVTYVCVGAK